MRSNGQPHEARDAALLFRIGTGAGSLLGLVVFVAEVHRGVAAAGAIVPALLALLTLSAYGWFAARSVKRTERNARH